MGASRKKWAAILILVSFLCSSGKNMAYAKNESPFVGATAGILMEWHTGTVLWSKNAFKRMHPASVTKMMTALLAVEQGRMEDKVTVSHEAASQMGSSMFLEEGDVFTLQDLLYGLMLNSGNDAAWAIAEHIGKSAEGFFEMMNQRAKELGALNTKYANPHGLTDPNHYTTAFDLSLLAKKCLRHPLFKSLVATKEKDVIEAEEGTAISLSNTNQLLWTYLGADGVKTGTTVAAGECLVASATRDHLTLLAVILQSPNRWGDAQSMFEYGFNNFYLAKISNAGSILLTAPWPQKVSLVCLQDLWACVPKCSAASLNVEIELPIEQPREYKRGEIVGRAFITLGDKVLGQTDLLTSETLYSRDFATTLILSAYRFLKFLVSRKLI